MTSTTNKTISKVAAIVAASALVAMSVVIAPAAHADTTTTTTMTSSQVAALQAQIASLQAQLSAASGASTAASVVFNTNLTVGSRGADVTALQNFLISHGDGMSIAAGATGYFGAQTKAALAAYQSQNGISPAAGYFGPITRAKVNATAGSTTTTTTTTTTSSVAGCAAGAAFSSTTGQACGTTTTTTGTLNGAEGSIDNFKTVGASSTSFNAGDTEQVYGFEFKADGSDLSINRIDYDVYKFSGSGSVRPWNVLQTATLMDGNTTIATLDASNQNNWSQDGTDNSTQNQIYRIRFDGLKDVVKMGNTADYFLTFTTQSAVSTSNAGATYKVALAAQGVRATDAMGIQQYSPSSQSWSSFSVSSQTNGSAVISQGSDNPQTITVQGNQSSQTSNIVLNTFTIQAKTADLELYSLPVTVTTNTSTTTLNPGVLVRDLKLYSGSTLLDTESPASTMTSGQTITFTNLTFKIPAGTTSNFSIQADINKIDGATLPEGSTVAVTIPSNGGSIDLENSSGNTIAVTGGSTGNTITFRSIGLAADAAPTTSVSTVLASGGNGTTQTGTFNFTFNVTAFGQDIYLASTSVAYGGSNNGTYGLVVFDYTNGNTATSSNVTSSLTSTADRSTNGNYVIHSGQTKSVTVTASATAGAGHFYYAVLKNLYFSTVDTGTGTTSSITLPTSYQTAQVRIAS